MIDNVNFWEFEAEHYWSGTKKESARELAKNFIFSGDYIGSRKVDGHWFSFQNGAVVHNCHMADAARYMALSMQEVASSRPAFRAARTDFGSRRAGY